MEVEEFIAYLKELDEGPGGLYCVNFLTRTQGLSLPDAVLFFDIFVRMK